MDSEQPQQPVAVLVLVADLGGPANARAVQREDGEKCCMVDNTFLDDNPVARESAFKAFRSLFP